MAVIYWALFFAVMNFHITGNLFDADEGGYEWWAHLTDRVSIFAGYFEVGISQRLQLDTGVAAFTNMFAIANHLRDL